MFHINLPISFQGESNFLCLCGKHAGWIEHERGNNNYNNNNNSFKIKMSDRNFTQRFDVFMTSLSSDNKITVQQCYICGERCDYSLTYLFKQIVSRGWNPIACSG